ncbi:uncharacterized protein LOC133741091 [Rosa rugosa]|uniref:uncharacterized protein LOC133741091 n=1 Tax=Rosa rugosa TaxID=74645 RepID=UPI002B405873|nr:uncharacterized protein LOC133741091 [Rosa rugosa]
MHFEFDLNQPQNPKPRKVEKKANSYFQKNDVVMGVIPSSVEQEPSSSIRVESREIDVNHIERDPGKRLAISSYPLMSVMRGDDESVESSNRGNVIEVMDSYERMNEEVAKVTLENASRNATYTSPKIQKEILSILANRVRRRIREEAKFCLLVDEALDESKKEQMTIILRFVDSHGIINVVDSSAKRVSELKSTKEVEVVQQIAAGEVETGKGANQTFSSTKGRLEKSREDGWVDFFASDVSFCDAHTIDAPDFSARRMEEFQDLYTLYELCQEFVNTITPFLLIERLISLVMTHPVSTTITERAFATMKLIKNRLQRKMSDDFLADLMIVHIKREIVDTIDSNSVIDEFYASGNRIAQLK